MSITKGPNLGLFVNGAPGEAHYSELMEFLRGIDVIVQARVLDRDLAAPPPAPADGDMYIVPPSWGMPTKVDQLAHWSSVLGGWEYLAPKPGWAVYVLDELKDYQYSGTAWVVKSSGGSSGLQEDFISGLNLKWQSASSVSVEAGRAYIPALAAMLNTGAITKSGLTLTASTFYHLYLFSNLGVPDIELSTTVPDAPYLGTARTKTGDPSRRYLGSVLTNASGGIYKFQCTVAANSFDLHWISKSNAAPWRLVGSGTATTPTNISAASVIACDAVTHLFVGAILNTNTPPCDMSVGISGEMDASAGSPELTAEIYCRNPFLAGQTLFYLPPNPVKRVAGSNNIQYVVAINSGTGGNLAVDTRGYRAVR